MGTKNNPGKFDCMAKAEPDEPYFILLARDPAAAALVEMWCELRREFIRLKIKPREDIAKVIEAHNIAGAMREWREDK
jgi:hypothetical protein